jgi:carbon monoxide dehydrogenase subunit G
VKITGQYEFAAGRDDVWKGLHDPQVLAATMPGAHRLEPTGDNEYAITVSVGVGSVKGSYDGVFAVTDTAEGEACTVRATASGRPGSVETVAKMQLDDVDGGGAHMVYEAEATVTGPLAGVGQRLMAAAARRTTEQFLDALDAYLVAPPGAEAEAGAADFSHEIVRAQPGATDTRVIITSALAGFVLALIGVAVGRWTARR